MTSPAPLFAIFVGYVAWYPLQSVGPITVALETASLPGTRYPIYVEVVPLEGLGDYRVCDSAGSVVATVYGHNYDPCGIWDEIGPVDITTAVPIGSFYAIRLYFPGHWRGFAPAFLCLRVTAHPVETTRVAPTSWGLVKALYK